MKNNHLENSIPNGLDHLSHAQRERLAYIEFRLYFLGEARRQDLIQRFGIAPAVATRDFAQYRESFPENINFDNKTKRYVLGDGFSAAFRHVSERVLTALSQGFGEGGSSMGALLTCELPLTLNNPSVDILAPVTRAIHNKKVIRMEYKSFTSGASVREIIPFALVNDGLRWHVRAYDRKSTEFRDFVLTRMLATTVVDNSPIENHELAAADIQWNRIVELDLVPHPNQEHSQIIEGDYGMIAGVLRINVRAANAGYVLRQWLVDCSPNHCLKGNEYRLWLKNHLALYNVSSASFAPGYEAPG
ncbi:MAG: WYL domain-containing protein [Methylovulum sp.]|nr:WYL domain-containing protein [Methylovulum sp.]